MVTLDACQQAASRTQIKEVCAIQVADTVHMWWSKYFVMIESFQECLIVAAAPALGTQTTRHLPYRPTT